MDKIKQAVLTNKVSKQKISGQDTFYIHVRKS